jgi:hypothetical protein
MLTFVPTGIVVRKSIGIKKSSWCGVVADPLLFLPAPSRFRQLTRRAVM